jgi:hypothetical protein
VQGKQQEGRHYNPTRKGLPLFRLIKLIATPLQFNLTGIKILDRHIAVISSLHERDIIESVCNGNPRRIKPLWAELWYNKPF